MNHYESLTDEKVTACTLAYSDMPENGRLMLNL